MTDRQSSQRIDRWIWHARFTKTRSLAQKLIGSGRVRIDREKISSASRLVKPGNVLTISLQDRVRIIEIVDLSERRGPYSEASLLYKDLSPEKEADRADMGEKTEPISEKFKRPDKHERRKAIKLKQYYPD
ncbi:MAG: RNA-binding S4 domain-containing protein [Rhizobiaceae bacterium]